METPKSQMPGFLDRARSHRLTSSFVLLGTLSAGILAGSVLTHGVSGKEVQKTDTSDARPIVIPSPVALSNGFSQLVRQVGPAVVNINTESLPKQSSQRNGKRGQRSPHGGGSGGGGSDDQQDNMQDFFNRFFGGQGGQGGQGDGDDDAQGGERRALGSGFIVDPRGYIITNNHVVDKADKIYVKLSTDAENPTDPGRPATVVGTDRDTDVAVIKIDAPAGLPTIKIGNSDGAQVGDWVLAIGSPFSLSKTVTAGIISGKNRTIDEPPGPGNVATNQFQRFIQTDAAINPGNSGGPLVNMAGEVVGMNTAIFTSGGASSGVGFAMPSNTIASVYNMLIGPEHKVTRGSIGITFQSEQSSAVSRMYGATNGGVIVGSVSPKGGAGKAGLQPGDVITTIDGRSIKDGDDLVADISARKVGSSVKIGYLRSGKQDSAAVIVGDRSKTYADLGNAPDDDNDPGQADNDAGQAKLGIIVAAIPPQIAQKIGKKGVIVTAAAPGSFAEDIGLGRGEIIVEINKRPVTDEASYKAIVAGLKSKDDVVFVVRDPQGRDTSNRYLGGTLP